MSDDSKMQKYTVTLKIGSHIEYEIEAKNPKEAIKEVKEIWDVGDADMSEILDIDIN